MYCHTYPLQDVADGVDFAVFQIWMKPGLAFLNTGKVILYLAVLILSAQGMVMLLKPDLILRRFIDVGANLDSSTNHKRKFENLENLELRPRSEHYRTYRTLLRLIRIGSIIPFAMAGIVILLEVST